MTIDFICEELAELFDSPCNYSPMDEKMFQDSYCESHCGKITDKECWKQYFEKVWADRKTEPSICDGCKFYDGEDCYSQEFCKVKTEPQTDCSWQKGE